MDLPQSDAVSLIYWNCTCKCFNLKTKLHLKITIVMGQR